MGTRGYRIVRYRKRYYVFYNHWDSYPEGLGKDLVKEIPTDPEEYQKWLAFQREEAAGWERLLEHFLCIKCTVDEDSEDEEESYAGRSNIMRSLIKIIKTQTGLPTFMTEGLFPAFWPKGLDFMIEWTYTLDLDREIFSVCSGAHLSMKHIPRDAWIAALDSGPWGGRYLLPGLLPEGCNTNLVRDYSPPSTEMIDMYGGLQVQIVKPKGISGISPPHLHTMLLGGELLAMVQESYQQALSATLLSWGVEDLAFREFAYATLCLASWDRELSLVTKDSILSNTQLPFIELKEHGDEISPEFVGHLGIGCHLDGTEPGSAPNASIYWLGDVLVHLVPRLELHGKIDEGVARTVQYCYDNHRGIAINAVLTSVEYVVLVRVYPGGRVEHTELLPLFDFNEHLTMDAHARYGAEYVDAVQKAKLEEKAAKEAEEQQKGSTKQETKGGASHMSEETLISNFMDFIAGKRDTIVDGPENAVNDGVADLESEQESTGKPEVEQADLQEQGGCINEPVEAKSEQGEGEEAESNRSDLNRE